MNVRDFLKNKRVFMTGLIILIAGFLVLTKVNSDATNWAGVVSPVLIIAGYITIAIGIIL